MAKITLRDAVLGQIVSDGLDELAIVKECVHGNRYYAYTTRQYLERDDIDISEVPVATDFYDEDQESSCC